MSLFLHNAEQDMSSLAYWSFLLKKGLTRFLNPACVRERMAMAETAATTSRVKVTARPIATALLFDGGEPGGASVPEKRTPRVGSMTQWSKCCRPSKQAT